MFSFFHRTTKIHLDCFTTENHVCENTPIVKATKTLPKYFVDLPTPKFNLKRDINNIFVKEHITNLKDCYAFLEYFQNAITIRHWADLYIEVTKEKYDYYSSFTKPEEHNRNEIGEGFVNYHHIKLISPWILKEKSGVKFAWVGAEWNLDSYNFKVLPGIINFNINHHTNVNLMLPKEEKNIIIPAGLPIVNLIPLTDKKIKLVNQVITEKEMDSMRRSPQQSYFHGWRTSKRLLKENKSKCPFGFGE